MADKKTAVEQKNVIDNTMQWYGHARPMYEGLTKTVCDTLEKLIKDKNIDCLSVTGRTKSLESLAEKLQRKEYVNPVEEITDLSGVRVTVYIESDVEKISKLVRKSFHVHPDKSLDKVSELGVDRMGYRSVHFVCDLGKKRTCLPEYAHYAGLVFEVQIRTLLQHAWAEIEHDRNYKLSGVLPAPLERRLHVAAGALEMVDRELNSIANEIDGYKEEVARKAAKGQLQIGINTTSLNEYLKKNYPSIGIVSEVNLTRQVIEELGDFSVKTLADLQSILTPEYIEAFEKSQNRRNYIGFLRLAMMYADLDRYFQQSWKKHWSALTHTSRVFLNSKYGEEKIKDTIAKYKLGQPK